MSFVNRHGASVKLSNDGEVNMDIDNMDIPSRCDISDLMVSFMFSMPIKLCLLVVHNTSRGGIMCIHTDLMILSSSFQKNLLSVGVCIPQIYIICLRR